FAAVSAAICAAKGVDFLEPVNPKGPAELQPITFPLTSSIVIMVLLNVERICATPVSTCFFTLRLRVLVLRAIYYLIHLFLLICSCSFWTFACTCYVIFL